MRNFGDKANIRIVQIIISKPLKGPDDACECIILNVSKKEKDQVITVNTKRS